MGGAGEPPLDTTNIHTKPMEPEAANGEAVEDLENNSLHQPLLKRNATLSASHLAMVGAKVSHIESLDYEYVSLSVFRWGP